MPCFVQLFVEAVLICFQSLDPLKEGAKIKRESDLKNEIQMITLNDSVYKMWEEYINTHMEGGIIDPCTKRPYNEGKNFKLRVILL